MSLFCVFLPLLVLHSFIHTNFARLTTLNNDVLHVNFTRRLTASLADWLKANARMPKWRNDRPTEWLSDWLFGRRSGCLGSMKWGKNLKCCICKTGSMCASVCVCARVYITLLMATINAAGWGSSTAKAQLKSASCIAYLYKFKF